MYKRSNFLDNDNFNQLELMYYHLHDGYKHVKEEFCKEFNTSNATINNLVSRLKQLGILIKDDGKIKILPAIQLDFSKNIVLQITLENETT